MVNKNTKLIDKIVPWGNLKDIKVEIQGTQKVKRILKGNFDKVKEDNKKTSNFACIVIFLKVKTNTFIYQSLSFPSFLLTF